MKSVIKESRPDNDFPCLLINKRQGMPFVVLFTAPKCGTVIFSGHTVYPVGAYGVDWKMSDFELFTGTIELS